MFDVKKYISLARQVVAEGSVLLKNDRAALPLAKGCKVASFGRSQFNYYKSGTGSGGLVNTAYVVSILDALKNSEDLILNEKVLKTYEDWVVDHPADNGVGWATVPWCQQEMSLEEELVKKAAEESDVAVITIARTAGEDKDNSATEGSYMLTAEEEKMLEVVCRYFEKTIVVLNVGAIIDMKWVKTYDPAAVLYVWQGGQEGGNGVLDLLTGKVSPSGKLADTISEDITDNPSTANFGDPDNNIYAEDIYVGYRYFESFAKDKVVYPFGFGLSYTTFTMKAVDFSWDGDKVVASVEVTNIGAVAGKEVVQLYVSAPQGKIGKAARVLCGFAKTKELAPGESEVLTITCGKYYLASYDDSGLSGYKSAYVLENGTYTFYAGSDVRCEMVAGTFELAETVVVDQLTPAMSPVVAFERMRAVETEKGLEVGYEPAPLREYNLWARINENRPADIEYTGDKGYKLADVKSGKVTMEEFVAQIPVEQLAVMLRGEGMGSPKVTPGTGGAFGGLSPALGEFGIPIACCTDGPSGLRMDVGTLAFSIPNGACLACTFNEQLSIDLFDIMGVELRKNKIDTLLGPGMNLHRNPLNGRNFEYFSEDPFLTGKMATAQLKGMHKHNVTGTIKHFIGNNQEFRRHFANGIVSERALRELYLKSFEIACKEGGAYCIMSTYGPINGFWTASNYDLLTHILRKEWGYKGLVMSDWWAKGNEEGEEGTHQENAAMVRSQNDMFMVVSDSEGNSNNDNILESVGTPKLTLGEVQRGAMNVLRVLMDMPVMDRWLDCEEECYKALYEQEDGYETGVKVIDIDVNELGGIPVELIPTETGSRPKYNLIFKECGTYRAEITMRSNAYSDLAQMPVSVFKNGNLVSTISMKGTDIEWTTTTINIGHCNCSSIRLELFFGQTGLEVQSCKIYQVVFDTTVIARKGKMMRKRDQLILMAANYTEDQAVAEKFADHLEELFDVLVPERIGVAFEEALQKEQLKEVIRLCASYYRQKPDNSVPGLSATGDFNLQTADKAIKGIMREVNIDYSFPEGQIDFLFDPTTIKGPRNHEWLWQFNRHYYWSEMARAYRATGDEKYAKAFENQLLSWVAQTKVPEGFNKPGSAWRTIECGIRLMGSWQVAFDGFKKSSSVSDFALLLMIASMHRQTMHLVNHPTGGNWLMMESNGVYAFAGLFDELTDAEENRRIAAKRLLEEMKQQILPDGMHNELSPDYQSVVFNCAANFYSLAVSLGHAGEIPADFVELIERTVHAAVLLSTPAFTQPRTNDTYTILTERFTGRAEKLLPQKPEYRFVNSRRREGMPPEGETASAFLPYAGFAVMRSDWTEDATYLCFDVGPLGRAHKHQDKLNVNIYKGSEELLYDDGGGQYEISDARSYGISGYGHNTVLVDGMAQNRKEPLEMTEPLDACWITNETFDYAKASYDDVFGTEERKPAIHTREVRFCKPGFYCVKDQLTSADGQKHSYEVLFHLDTTKVKEVAEYENGIISEYGRKYELLMIPLDEKVCTSQVKILSAQTEPVYQGWYNGRNESNLHEATTVSRVVEDMENYQFITLLFPVKVGEALPSVKRRSDGMVEVVFEGQEYRFNAERMRDF